MSKQYTKTKQDPPHCIHNAAVNCQPNERRCETCGWDPVVAADRLAEFCKKHHIAIPEFKPETKEE